MSHQPPIPAGNTSPFPRIYPHHEATAAQEAEDGDGEVTEPIGRTRDARWPAISAKALGAAAGIGSAALLAALLYAGNKKKGQRAH